jgi:hypothetical protein
MLTAKEAKLTSEIVQVEKDGRAFKVSYNKGKLTSAVECVCVV